MARTGRPSTAHERRGQIVDAFEECILEYGVHGASFNRIGEVIGLDGSTIHYYYPTKADLLSAMFERMAVVQREWTEETLSMLPGEGRALSLVEHVFSASLDRPRVAKQLNALSYAAEKDRDLRRRLKRIYRSLVAERDQRPTCSARCAEIPCIMKAVSPSTRSLSASVSELCFAITTPASELM